MLRPERELESSMLRFRLRRRARCWGAQAHTVRVLNCKSALLINGLVIFFLLFGAWLKRHAML